MRVERALVGIVCVASAIAAGCNGGGRLAYNLPPSSRLMEPGPGVGGPGPGVIPPAGAPYGMYGGAVGRYGDGMGGYIGGPGGAYDGACEGGCSQVPPQMQPPTEMPNDSGIIQASYKLGSGGEPRHGHHGGKHFGGGDFGDGPAACGCGPGYGGGCGPMGGCADGSCALGGCDGFGDGCEGAMRPGTMEAFAAGGAGVGVATSQIAFLGDEGIQVSWDVGGYGTFDSSPLVIPGRQDFYQGAIYRLRLTNIPGRPGVELFPTLEVAPVTPRTDAYLAHSPIPVQFTEEDFDQVLSGNFVTKVIYLPDPEFQELALAGVETLVSTRLPPGVDPISEADRRGSILAILRMGNKDLRGPGNYSAPAEYEPQEMIPAEEGMVPASYVTPTGGTPQQSNADHALYSEPVDAQGQPVDGEVTQAQYCGPAPGYAPCGYGDAYGGGNMPMGMPTGGFAPPAVPPNMVAGAPQWGMPITGTPIGLPGPPHIPLGVPAGLQKHTMKNRTRVLLPPPVSHVHMSVKQRPGMNYPRPVSSVHVDETQREPFTLIPGWLRNHRANAAAGGGGYGGGHGGHGGYGANNCY